MDDYIFESQQHMFHALDHYILNNIIHKIFGGVTHQSLSIIHISNKCNKEYGKTYDIHLLNEITITNQFTIKEWKHIINAIINDELSVLLEVFADKCKHKRINVKLSHFNVQVELGNIIKFYISHN